MSGLVEGVWPDLRSSSLTGATSQGFSLSLSNASLKYGLASPRYLGLGGCLSLEKAEQSRAFCNELRAPECAMCRPSHLRARCIFSKPRCDFRQLSQVHRPFEVSHRWP